MSGADRARREKLREDVLARYSGADATWREAVFRYLLSGNDEEELEAIATWDGRGDVSDLREHIERAYESSA